MKFNIEIECTAKEARECLGLPDVTAMQERLLGEAEERMRTFVRDTDTQRLIEMWLPVTNSSIDEAMKMWMKFGSLGMNKNNSE